MCKNGLDPGEARLSMEGSCLQVAYASWPVDWRCEQTMAIQCGSCHGRNLQRVIWEQKKALQSEWEASKELQRGKDYTQVLKDMLQLLDRI